MDYNLQEIKEKTKRKYDFKAHIRATDLSFPKKGHSAKTSPPCSNQEKPKNKARHFCPPDELKTPIPEQARNARTSFLIIFFSLSKVPLTQGEATASTVSPRSDGEWDVCSTSYISGGRALTEVLVSVSRLKAQV